MLKVVSVSEHEVHAHGYLAHLLPSDGGCGGELDAEGGD